MNLEQVTIEIRPRRAWEAVDLGVLMARRWWLPMTKVWVAVSFPIFLLSLLVPQEHLWISALLLWWLKPLFERPLLHILSRTVFNDLPDTRTTLRAYPALALKQIFMSLTFRRLSPTRSMDISVLQLESLSGTQRRQRLNTLHREDAAAASWLTLIGIHLESFISLGVFSLIWAMIPREIEIDWAGIFLDQNMVAISYLTQITTYLAMTLVAPFYVACGFSLYLNRRIKLEAWDLDIAFRRIIEKRSQTQKKSTTNGAINLALTLMFSFVLTTVPAPTHAESDIAESNELTSKETSNDAADYASDSYELNSRELNGYELNRTQARQFIKKVMQQKEFSHKEIRNLPKFKDRKESDFPLLKKFVDFFKDFKGFLGIAKGIELLLWLLVLSLIAYLVYRYRDWLALQFVKVKTPARSRPLSTQLFGMDVTRESLPADISNSALHLFQVDDTRAALALLYRASLAHLVFTGVDIHSGHTEQECADLMRSYFDETDSHERSSHEQKSLEKSATQKRVEYFYRLTQVWRQLAYGHQMPTDDVAQKLCADWNHYWLGQKSHTDIRESNNQRGVNN